MPPADAIEPLPEIFIPASDLAAWIRATFIDDSGPLYNPDHAHLGAALIGCLWTNVPNTRKMKGIAAQAEMPRAQGDAWTRARQEHWMREWFGDEPDFVITVDAPLAAVLTDVQFCALVEHELYHCAQATDGDGLPKFTKDGNPVFAMKGHDVEEFVGVVRRYGAVGAGIAELVEAANAGPTISTAHASWACGTCGKPA